MAFNLKHTGFVIPEIYSEPYTDKPFEVSIKATSLGNLNNIRYLNAGEFYTGNATLMTIITRCFDKLGYAIDIWDSVNTYEVDMDSGLSPLVQAEIDQEAFIFIERGRRKAKSCYQVLEDILKPFVVNVFQDYGHWVIVPIELRGKSRTVRRFNSSGALQETFTHDPSETFSRTPTDGNYCWVFSDQRLEKRAQIREVESVYEHGEIENLAENGSFNDFIVPDPYFPFFAQPEDWQLSDLADFEKSFPDNSLSRVAVSDADGGPWGLKFKNKETATGAYIYYENTDTVEFKATDEVRFSVRYFVQALGSPTDQVSVDFQIRIGIYYLTSNGSWTTTPTDIAITDVGDSSVSNIFELPTGLKEFGIQSEPIPDNGDLEVRIYVPENDTSSSNVEAVYSEIRLDYFPQGEPQQDATTFYGERDIDSYADEFQYDVEHGDGPINLYKPSYIFNNLATAIWSRGDLDGSIHRIMIQQIFREYETLVNLIQGTQRSSKLFDRYFTEYGHTYTVNAGSFDDRFCYFNGELIEVLDGTIEVDVYKIEQDGTETLLTDLS